LFIRELKEHPHKEYYFYCKEALFTCIRALCVLPNNKRTMRTFQEAAVFWLLCVQLFLLAQSDKLPVAKNAQIAKKSASNNKKGDPKFMEKSARRMSAAPAAAASSSIDANICPQFGGGLFVILDQVPLSQASSVCLSAGLGLANLTFSNNFVASQLMVQCGAGLAWISSFERVRSNTCVVLTGDGNVFFPPGQACQSQIHPVICQDFAATLTDTATQTFTTCTTSVETDTVLSVSTFTSTIVTTTTSTATMKRHCPTCVQTRTVFLPGGVTTRTFVTSSTTTITLMQKSGILLQPTVIPTTSLSVLERPPKELVVVQKADSDGDDHEKKHLTTDCPMNVPACQGEGESGEFVVLRTYLSFERGACSCRKLGMRLANINAQNIQRARKALSKCAGGNYDFPAWINSWEGDDYGRTACLALSSGGAINAQSTCLDGLPVLCQRKELDGGKAFLQLQSPVYSLCPTTQNNLFIVSSQAFLAGQDPAVACGTFNMIPANIFDNTRAAAAAVFAVCSAGDPNAVSAQANSFDGLQGAACNLVDDTQAVLIVDNTNGEVAQNCFVNQKYFLCMPPNVPVTTSISTVFTGPFFFVTTTTVRTGSVSTVFRTTTVSVGTGTTVRTTEVELISLSLTTITSTTTTTIKITSALPTSTTTTTGTSSLSVTTTTTTTTATSPTTASTGGPTTATITTTVTSCPTMLTSLCPLRRAGMVLLTDPVPYRQAECACRQHGLRLAELNLDSFQNAAALEYDCLGPFQKAWIGGYLGDASTCMALYVGAQPGGVGAAALPLFCDSHAPVICY
jgi:hypothetical protein